MRATLYLRTAGDDAAMKSAWDDRVPRGRTPARATVGAKSTGAGCRLPHRQPSRSGDLR